MKNSLGLILIGLLIRYGSADVSHLSNHHGYNGYLPPQQAQNLPIQQDNNGINSQSYRGAGQVQAQTGYYDNESRDGYLPPYQGHVNNHNHDHQHEEQGYLPPMENQVQRHNHHHDHHDESQYLPPPQPTQSLVNENQDHHSGHQEEDRGYLPPLKEQVQNEQHKEDGFDPNVEVSYHNDYAISRINAQVNHQFKSDHSKSFRSNEQYEDNSNGYNYYPPSQSFQDEYNQLQQQISFNDNPQGSAKLAPTTQTSFHNSEQAHQEDHQDFHNQNYFPAFNGNQEQQSNRDYLPPSHSNNFNQAQQQVTELPSHQNQHLEHSQHQEAERDYLPPKAHAPTTQTSFQNSEQAHQKNHQNLDYLPPSNPNQEQQANRDYLPPRQLNHLSPVQQQATELPSYQNEHSHQGSERDYLPPIGALELPRSSDTLHIIPPLQLGIPIKQTNNQPLGTDFVNVPLPIPQVGYYVVPAVMTQLPSLNEPETEQFKPATKISTIENQQQLPMQEDIHLADYSIPSKSEIRIIPSIQTAQEIASQGYLTPNQIIQNEDQHFADIDYSSPQSNNLASGQQFFPPLIQTQQQDNYVNQHFEQNKNQPEVQNTHHSQSSFLNFARSAVNGVNNQNNQISNSLEQNDNQENAYLPPINSNNFQQQQTVHNQDQQVYNNPSQPDNYNQMTNLQTYMNSVKTNDRYGSLQFQPLPAIESNPSSIIPPIMFSKPSAIIAYAPGMAYKASNNVPFTSFTQAGYLPPAGNSRPEENQLEFSSSIGFELNDQAKQNLAQNTIQDNTVFPLADLLGGQQITNHHDSSVKNIDVHDSSDQTGVRTIEILGQSNENPQGDHKVLRIISKVPNPQGIHQTIKIFADRKEKALPANNGYLPPSTSTATTTTTVDANARKLRQTASRHRSH